MFYMYCGNSDNVHKAKQNDYEEVHEPVKQNGTYTTPDGKEYVVKNRILYDEEGYDVGRVPNWWG